MSSVEYLTPGTSSWSVKTAENSEDLIADPFWRTKQSSLASADAILIRCGVGFIKRSVDGGDSWDDVTPTTDPPNDAGDAPAPLVGNVTFNQLDASFSDQDVFVALVTWQNAASEWRTWLYHSDDNFATNGTWTGVGGNSGNDLTSFSNDTWVEGGAPAWIDPDPTWSQSYNTWQCAVKLTNTKMVVVYETNANAPYTYSGYTHVIDIQGDGSLSVGTKQGPWNYTTNGDANEVHGVFIFRWSDQEFLILSHEYDWEFSENLPGNGAYALLAKLCSVSGQTVTYGDAITVEDDYYSPSTEFYPYHWDFKKLPGLNNDGIVTYSNWDSFPAYQNEGMARILRKSAPLTLSRSSSSYSWATIEDPGCDAFAVVAFDDTNAVVFHDTVKDIGDGTYEMYAVPITITGFSISPGTRQHMSGKGVSGGIRARRLTDTKTVVLFDLYGTTLKTSVVSRSGSTYTSENTQNVVTGGSYIYDRTASLHELNENRWVVSWDEGDDILRTRVGYLTATYTHAYGTVGELEGAAWGYVKPHCIFAGNDYLFLYYGDENAEEVRAATHALDAGYEAKGLGVSIGKGTGNVAWVTVYDTTDGLNIVGINLTTFAEDYRVNLGGATEAEVNNKTWIAYPFAMWGGTDTSIVVYGRMDTTGGIAHVAYSTDGSLFFIAEDGWGANHCGSLIRFPAGLTYAVRNDGAASRLYTGAITALALKSVLPLGAGVDPHGMVIDPIDGAVVACSRNAGSVMVGLSPYPYAVWANITTDHGVSEGINAVAVL